MTVKEFMEQEVNQVKHNGVTIYYSNTPNYEWYAVIEDADGNQELVDVSHYGWEDFDDFLTAAWEEYQGK